MDPYLFSRVKQVSARAKPIAVSSVMYGATVGRVDASNHADFAVGDRVQGLWGWQDYVVSDGAGISKLDTDIAHPSHVLGALGAAGLGAYVAVEDVLKVKPGETLFCSAATGALGQIVGQLGKLRGANIIGAAGTVEKCRSACEQLGYDSCLNHRGDDFERHLSQALDCGIDAMIVSTGGRTFDAAFPLMNLRGRVALLGFMANYSTTESPSGPDRTFMLLNDILLKRLEVRGSLVLDHLRTSRYDDFRRDMKGWIADGSIRPLEDITKGLENAANALHAMFDGKNVGKSVVHVSE